MLRILKTLVLAGAGGLLFKVVGLPLPWMLGPLAVLLLWQHYSGERAAIRGELRNSALIVLGLVMGRSFSREAAARIVQQLSSIVLTSLLIIIFSLAMGYLAYRYSGIKLSSAILGSIPGGLSQMVVLSEEVEDAEVAVVTLMQTVRLLLVVFLVPFVVKSMVAHTGIAGEPPGPIDLLGPGWGYLLVLLFLAAMGAVLAARMKLPNPYLMGPFLVVALLVLGGFQPPQLPSWLIIVAQVIMGISMAANFKLEESTSLWRLLLLSVAGNVVVVFFTFGLGFLLSYLHNQSLVTSFLSMAPGGVSEMGITAVAVGADLAVVSSYQFFRTLFILFVVSPILCRVLPHLSALRGAVTDTPNK